MIYLYDHLNVIDNTDRYNRYTELYQTIRQFSIVSTVQCSAVYSTRVRTIAKRRTSLSTVLVGVRESIFK